MEKLFFNATVENLNSEGQGICSLDGLKVFIDHVLPQEKISAKLSLQKKSYGLANLVELKTVSKERVIPICPLFSTCGGCQIMHLDYPGQLQFKTNKVQEAIRRIAKLDIQVNPCVPSPQPLHYRNKIQLPFFEKDGQLQLGLYQKGSHEAILVDQCFIHCKLGEKIFQEIRKLLPNYPLFAHSEQNPHGLRHLLIKTSTQKSQCLVVFIAGSKKFSQDLKKLSEELVKRCPEIQGTALNINQKRYNSIVGDQSILLWGKPYIHERLGDFTFKISSHSFFQVNPLQAHNLYQKALEYAKLSSTDQVLDAYCGIGTLTLFAAQKAHQVVGVECVPAAISDAIENAKENSIQNVQFLCQNVEKYIGSMKAFDAVFLNPPRKGCDVTVLQAIASNHPKKIVYISCDPATLARDIQILNALGYKLKAIQPFDMFPQTAHVETCALLEPL